MNYIPTSWKIAIALVTVLAAFGGSFYAGWHVRSIKATADEQTAANQAATAFNKQMQDAIKDRDALELQLAAANDAEQRQYKEAQNETNTLRGAVDSGTVRLRIPNAACSSDVPKATASSSLDTGTGATLDATARQDYFALRSAISDTEAKLNACQGELRARVR